APQVLLPVRPGRVDAAERDEQPVALLATLVGQPAVGRVRLLVQYGLEAAGPGPADPVPAQLAHEFLGAVVLQGAEGPAEQMHVAIDELGTRGGSPGGGPAPSAGRPAGPPGIAKAAGSTEALRNVRRPRFCLEDGSPMGVLVLPECVSGFDEFWRKSGGSSREHWPP